MREDVHFELTQEQVKLIDPELRWVIAFPLKARMLGLINTLDVCIVDGLTECLSVQEMQQMYYAIQRDVNLLASDLEKLAGSRVTISVEKL